MTNQTKTPIRQQATVTTYKDNANASPNSFDDDVNSITIADPTVTISTNVPVIDPVRDTKIKQQPTPRVRDPNAGKNKQRGSKVKVLPTRNGVKTNSDKFKKSQNPLGLNLAPKAPGPIAKGSMDQNLTPPIGTSTSLDSQRSMAGKIEKKKDLRLMKLKEKKVMSGPKANKIIKSLNYDGRFI